MTNRTGTWLLLVICWVGYACENFEPSSPTDNEILDGPVEGLTTAENIAFTRGDVAFNDEIFTAESGLGPMFVATSCGSCHPGDGKGHPFTTLTRFGGPHGPQLQNRALPGFTPETLPPGAAFVRLTPPANTGLGFLDAVADDDILAWADPNDDNNDGISGTPSWVTVKDYLQPRPASVEANGKYVGRFGKKAIAYDLFQQTAQAYNEDIGISSSYEPRDTYAGLEVDPEISNQTILNVVLYLKTLKAPVQRNTSDNGVVAGRAVFNTIGCAKCHRPEFKTGASSIAAIAYKTFHPYTDLLLHDMGPALDDGYTEGSAETFEWRTPALWGLGLSKRSQGGRYFLLHDGRASSIDEAIRLHGGEAQNSKDMYQSITETERRNLISFLESL